MFSDFIKLIVIALSDTKDKEESFYSPQQTVVDLTSLLKGDKATLKEAFKETQNDFIKNVLATLSDGWDLKWQHQRLFRNSLKGSYDDLQEMQHTLDERKIPYETVVRQNPIRFKTTRDLLMAKRGILPAQKSIHRDLRRHIQMELSKKRA